MSPHRSPRIPTETPAGARPDRFPLRRREIALIVAFWTLLSAVSIANRMLDPRGAGPQLTASSAPVALAAVSALLWMVVTPVLFWLADRASAERVGARGGRALRVATLVAAAVALAVAARLTINAANVALYGPFPQRMRGAGPPPRLGPPPGFGPLDFRYFNDLLLAFGVVAAGLVRAYSLRLQTRQELAARLQAQLAEARLAALRQQLDPHFLFNTLNAVSALVERDPRGVRRMISRLSELLRHSIEGSAEQEVPLRRELALLDRYLDIMQVRFQGALDVRRAVDERALDCLVPNLILQPLVENAIKHGIGNAPGPGWIAVEAAVDGDALVLRVRDSGRAAAGTGNGTGDDPVDGSGVGLRNTVARLEQLYGSAQHFELRVADAAEGGGAVAEVRLPFHTRGDLRVAGLPAAAD